MKKFKIGNHFIGDGHPTFIIGEIGINHGGSKSYCLKLVNLAIKSKVNAIKLQTINADESYVKGTISYNEFKDKQLDEAFIKKIYNKCKSHNIVLFSTPGDFASLNILKKLKMPCYKISSGLANNIPLIQEIASLNKPTIISTGMLFEHEIKDIIKIFKRKKNNKICLLKCTSLYPSPDDTLNLKSITTFKKKFPFPIGYSDHTLDDTAVFSAVSLGANIIEKHITLNKKAPRADHFLSIEPLELKTMVQKIRRIEKTLGSAAIMPVKQEIILRKERHRCLVASKVILKNEKIDHNNIGLKRPLKNMIGLESKYYNKIIGLKVKKNLIKNEPITMKILIKK
tara:strand:+ start:3339 stop:4361 length:1023 start_codon:yes stop_codon:yes gene_type:complete